MREISQVKQRAKRVECKSRERTEHLGSRESSGSESERERERKRERAESRAQSAERRAEMWF